MPTRGRTRTVHRPRRRPTAAAAGLLLCLLLAAAGCGGSPDALPENRDTRTLGTEDVVSAIATDPEIAARLPAAVRSTGKLTVGSSVGIAPIAFSPEGGGPPRGVDIDMADAVAKVLGLTVERQPVSGAALITGLAAGHYQLGTANLAVTSAREQAVDFVLYLTDGGGFAVRQDSSLHSVSALSQLCGLTVGTGAGTTFEATLAAAQGECAKEGRPPYRVETYSDAAAHFLALRQGHVDILMTTASVLRYAVTQQPGLRYLNDYDRSNVGFALPKGSPLAGPVRDAVNELIADGAYRRILDKWGLGANGITSSVIDPPASPAA
ncbi:polar amino acid transport system substrate-binding protein [Kitasatospora sp. MAA4]|uniref:ABC transporter substrate-binding protein n=1 Tax=Kitasatospora sp. MAA4 TaxID=3035093 RepID=UPI00247493B0|nr:ABC transporter substrate-binding protein [Kitasatospora sp. MAA4]MDH6132388.1 polar amino acid transport system substrate-binding protein [Kitasatospora sp. MAA4]